jgi:Ca-activated chloride channel homolog
MTCEELEPVLGAWLAGEIRPDERAAAEAHLLDCPACRADFELARIGWRAEWPGAPAPVLKAPVRRVPVFLKLGTAAAVALIGALALFGRPAPPPRTEPLLASFADATLGAIACVDEEGRPSGDLGLKEHRVSVEILDGVSLTTVEETFENRSDRRLEGTFRFPLPQDAAISRLALEVNGKMEEGTCLERQRAREVFESIVRRAMDPALLEWLPGGIFQCRIFPIEPRSTKRVIVGYTQVLPFARGKSTYVYPLAAEKTREHPPERLTIDVRARFSGTLAAMASPTHRIDVLRRDVHEAAAAFRASNLRPTSDFVLELETADDEVRLVAHKEGAEDGYVACFVAPRGDAPRAPRRYALLVDASASVSAPAFEAAKKVVDALKRAAIPGDRFNVKAFALDVEDLERARPMGGCDLLKALKSVEADETILIGEATPTLGETDRAVLLESVKGRRIRTIAVGSEVEIGFLEKLGPVARISPGEDVARRAAEIATTLGAPVVRNLRIEGPVEEVVGARDVFAGERVFLAARYKGAGGRLTVTADGWSREIAAPLPLQETGNAWVKRLWAQRRVSDLTDPAAITALGVKHQIMTPYTSFLVLETEKMWEEHQLKRQVGEREKLLAKSGEAEGGELVTKREVTRKMAHLLELSYMAFDQKRYDRCIKLCDEILLIDPHYAVAKELKEDVAKTRHKEEYHGVLAAKVEALKRRTDDNDEAMIPDAQTVRFPSRDEWAELSKRLTESVIRTEGEPIDAFRVKLEQANIELTKHLRDGERYLNARMYDKALEQFRAAGRSPGALGKPDLLRAAGRGIVRAKEGRIEEELRVKDARRSEAESEAIAGPVNSRRPKGISAIEEDIDGEWLRGRGRMDFFEKHEGWSGYLDVGSRVPLHSLTGSGGGPLQGATFSFDEPVDTPLQLGKDTGFIQVARRATSVRKLPLGPPASYTAKVEEGRLIQGRPLLPAPTLEMLRGRAVLRGRLEALLTRSAEDKELGKIEYDPQSDIWIGRDVPEALGRIDAEIKRLESGGVLPALESATVTLSVRGARVEDVIDSLQKMSGWAISLQGDAPSGTIAEIAIEDEPIRTALRAVADRIGAWVDIAEPGRAILRRSRPLRPGTARERIETLAEAAAREHGIEIHLDPACRGEVALPPEVRTTWDALMAGLKSLNRVAMRESAGRIRVMPPDELLGGMSIRVFQFRVAEIAVENAPAPELRWTLDDDLSIPLSAAGALAAVERNGRFVSLARVDERGRLDFSEGWSLGRALPGDEARDVVDLPAYLQRLPEDVRRDLDSVRALRVLRARLEAGR